MYKMIAFTLLLFANNIFAATASVAVPTITNSVSAGTTFKFTETLSGKLPAGYKVKIDLNNGKGLVAMTCSGTICTLSANTLPKNVDSATYKVGVYDSKGALQGATNDGYYMIVSTATSAYSKLSNSGATLSDSAKIGNSENDWACTKDNKNGLIWEVKTTDGGLRDMNKTYTNYFTGDSGYGDSVNSDTFVKAVNKQTLCGAANWRLPTTNEIKTLIVCSDSKYDVDGSCTNFSSIFRPTINTFYFPNTQDDWFWSSSLPSVPVVISAGVVSFYGGDSIYFGKLSTNFIRLVHQ